MKLINYVASNYFISRHLINGLLTAVPCRSYAKRNSKFTEAELKYQEESKRLAQKPKTSIRGTQFEYHDVETSIQYMKSEAFKLAYGTKFIWEWYVRNHKGRQPKSYTREKCITGSGEYLTGNPCPICRDPFLVVSYKNLELLRHFINENTGRLYPTIKTHVCQRQNENLEIAYGMACDMGLLNHNIPLRYYDYKFYYPELSKETAEVNKPSVLLGIVLGSYRKQINDIYNELKEEDINLKN